MFSNININQYKLIFNCTLVLIFLEMKAYFNMYVRNIKIIY